MGTPLPLPKKGTEPSPQFPAHFYCGKTVGCIKIPLGMEVGLSPEDFVLDGDPAPSPKKGVEPPVFDPCLLWPNGWMDQDGTWHGHRPQPRRLCVRWGSSPSPKMGQSPFPNFRPISIVAKRLDVIKMPLGMEVGLSPGDFVRSGPSTLPKKGADPPQFSAHVYCGQTAAWIKMPLGTDVGLGLRVIVLDGDPAPHS